jgi:cholesterol transport system auxiliary component
MNARWTLPAASALLLSACSGLLQNRVPEPDVYRLMPTSLHAGSVTHDAVLLVARPSARPGLDSDHLAVTLADRRSDVYAGARWEASVPRMVEGLLVDALRSTATARAVVSEHSAFRGRYLLQTEVTEFSADYGTGSAVPTIRISVRGELGIPSEHRLLATVTGSGAVVATADRRHDVVAAYQAAWDLAAAELVRAVDGALERAEHP